MASDLTLFCLNLVDFSVVQKNTLFQSANKVEFLKTPVVEKNTCQSVIGNVNDLVNKQAEGRLFAVVHLCGKQYKVTAGDIVVIEGYWAPTIGDKLRLEKVSQFCRDFPDKIC